jgi:hypothetical protein
VTEIKATKADRKTINARRKWVAALRSGKYKQCRGALMRVSQLGEETFCCLGVLGRVHQPDFFSTAATAHLPDGVVEKTGFDPKCGQNFATLNDRFGWSFDQIAKLIEQNASLSLFEFTKAAKQAVWDAMDAQTRLLHMK